MVTKTARATDSKTNASQSQNAKDAAETAALTSTEIRIQRAEVVEKLKAYALQGNDAFEAYVESCVQNMVKEAGLPRSTTLSQMQRAKITGASSFYTYVCTMRQHVRAGNIEAIKMTTSSSHNKSHQASKSLEIDPEEVISDLLHLHASRRLRASHYESLERILRARKR